MARKKTPVILPKVQVARVAPKHAYILDPKTSEWADYAAVQAQCWNLSGNELTRNLSGNFRPRSSQLAEPLWIDPGMKSGISVRELIFTSKKKKSQAGSEWSNILPKSSRAMKKPPLPHTMRQRWPHLNLRSYMYFDLLVFFFFFLQLTLIFSSSTIKSCAFPTNCYLLAEYAILPYLSSPSILGALLLSPPPPPHFTPNCTGTSRRSIFLLNFLSLLSRFNFFFNKH